MSQMEKGPAAATAEPLKNNNRPTQGIELMNCTEWRTELQTVTRGTSLRTLSERLPTATGLAMLLWVKT